MNSYLSIQKAARWMSIGLFAIGMSVAVVACSGNAQEANSPSGEPQNDGAETTDALQGNAVGAPEHMVRQMLRQSLAELELRPEQRAALEQIRKDLRDKSKPVKDARRDLTLAVADGVAAGTIDHARIDPQVQRLSTAVQALEPAFQEALNKVHATLDRAQRQKLVESLQAKGRAMAERAKGRPHDGQRGPGKELGLKRMADELGLAEPQREQIRQQLRAEWQGQHQGHPRGQRPDRAAMEAKFKALSDAFVADQFDAKTLQVGQQAPQRMQDFGGRMIRMVEVTLPVLNADQRAKLAQMIRARAEHQRPARGPQAAPSGSAPVAPAADDED